MHIHSAQTSRLFSIIAGGVFCFVTPSQASATRPDAKPSAVVVTQSQVDATIKQLSPIYTDDEPVRVIDAGAYNIGLFVVGRPKKADEAPAAADGARHVTEGLQLDHVAVVLRIISGSGVFVTGGVLADGHRIAADDPDLPVIGPGMRGKFIRGGEAHHIGVGDMVIVPAGIVHGWSSIEQPLTYTVLRFDPAKVLPLN